MPHSALCRSAPHWPRLTAWALGLGLCAALACGGNQGPAKYPDVKVRAQALSLTYNDPRKEWTDTYGEIPVLDRDEESTYPQKLPASAESELRARLTRVTAGQGPKLQVSAEVRRADVTFYNDSRGDFVRYDVALGFRVTTSSGALLDKGLGGAFRELPRDQATTKEMQRAFAECAIAAMDQYWASEETLETLNSQLARYLETHPNER